MKIDFFNLEFKMCEYCHDIVNTGNYKETEGCCKECFNIHYVDDGGYEVDQCDVCNHETLPQLLRDGLCLDCRDIATVVLVDRVEEQDREEQYIYDPISKPSMEAFINADNPSLDDDWAQCTSPVIAIFDEQKPAGNGFTFNNYCKVIVWNGENPDYSI